LPSERIEAELRKRPDPIYGQLTATASAREIRARLDAAAHALKLLDDEGRFGTGDERRGITLLIEAGDRTEDFVRKWIQRIQRIGQALKVGKVKEAGASAVASAT